MGVNGNEVGFDEEISTPPRRNFGGGVATGTTTGKEGKLWPNPEGCSIGLCGVIVAAVDGLWSVLNRSGSGSNMMGICCSGIAGTGGAGLGR